MGDWKGTARIGGSPGAGSGFCWGGVPHARAASGREGWVVIDALHIPIPRRRPWLREVILFAAALLVYQGSRALVIGDPATAFRHARDVMGFEKAAGVFVEPEVQRFL